LYGVVGYFICCFFTAGSLRVNILISPVFCGTSHALPGMPFLYSCVMPLCFYVLFLPPFAFEIRVRPVQSPSGRWLLFPRKGLALSGYHNPPRV
jgi:hypothetical protein